ncbi:hypothetical protein BH10ACI4_BH10ACI4_36490 [soil metagenome]
MAQSVQTGLVQATQVAQEALLQQSPNGIHYAAYGDTNITPTDLARMVQAVPTTIAAALTRKAYFFVPLAMTALNPEDKAEPKSDAKPAEPTMIAAAYHPELAENAICHRNVALGEREGVFISTRLLSDRFALAFEFFINIGHAFVDAVGVPSSFTDLVWAQAVADVRGETSQDAWESRALALPKASIDAKPPIDEKAKTEYLESAFSDAVAIYQLSLSVDFDYSELREREYPLLAPQPLAERLRMVAKLFPPNSTYEFAIRYRRRA